jgi:hypothetical protein
MSQDPRPQVRDDADDESGKSGGRPRASANRVGEKVCLRLSYGDKMVALQGTITAVVPERREEESVDGLGTSKGYWLVDRLTVEVPGCPVPFEVYAEEFGWSPHLRLTRRALFDRPELAEWMRGQGFVIPRG